MNLRTKTLSVMVVALLAITGATYAAAERIVGGGFASLEQDEAHQNLERTEQALSVELNRLDSTAADWSVWDDTYQFVQDGNTDYVEANVYDATLVNLRVDMMLFVDKNGDLVHAHAIDPDGAEAELDDTTRSALLASGALFDYEGNENSTKGVVSTASGSLVVASRPVLTSEGDGPIMGSVVLARWVDERLVSELSEVTTLDIALDSADPAGPAAGEETIKTVNSKTLSATTVIADVAGAPALTVQVTMPRTIFEEGQGTLRYLLLSLVFIGLTLLLLTGVVLELTVLRPVARLSTFVTSVGTQLNARAPGTGRDEIGHLGRAINGMLDTIERYSTALTEANTKIKGERELVERLNHSLEAKVADRTAELEMANSELRDRNRQLVAAMKQASTDGLTGLKNHRRFQEDIRQAAEQEQATGELAVFMADIDRFKGVNDEYGHQVGDQILTRVGDLFREVLGDQAVFRYGGDEFAMMTWVSSLLDAEELAENVRRKVAAEITHPAVTISVGVALYSEASSPEELVYHADAAMYAAKAAGKNRVRVWTRNEAEAPAGEITGR